MCLSCNCRDVQHQIFGRSFNLTDPQEGKEFVKAHAITQCRLPAERAARIAGELILEGRMKHDLAVVGNAGPRST